MIRRILARALRGGTRTVIAVVAAAVAGSAIAVAAIPSADGTIQTCYLNSNGALRVVNDASQCSVDEHPLAWNQRGPRGDTGPPGPPGASGGGGTASQSQRIVGTLDLGADKGMPILSYRFGGQLPGGGVGAGHGNGKFSFRDLEVTRAVDQHTPDWFVKVASGQRLQGGAALHASPAAGGQTGFDLSFNDARLVAHRFAVAAGGGPVEQLTINVQSRNAGRHPVRTARRRAGRVQTGRGLKTLSPAGGAPAGQFAAGQGQGSVAGDLQSLTFGVESQGSSFVGGGGGFGKATFDPVTIGKLPGASTPPFLQALQTGKRFQTVTAEIFDPGTRDVRLKLDLNDVVGSEQTIVDTGATGVAPLEGVSLVYNKIELTFFKPSGGTVKAVWNRSSGKHP